MQKPAESDKVEGMEGVTRARSIVKATTFRIVATVATIVAVYFITGSWGWAGTIGAVDLVLKSILYYLHERGWNKISWGRK